MEGVLKTVSTPIFTPITFLHDDARRRSQSRSPPMSPVRLANSLSVGDAPADEPRGLGLVDELDTPAPGHMASRPSPLTATTTVEPPIPASLEERFVKASDEEGKEKEHETGERAKQKQKGEHVGEEGKAEDAEVENMVLSAEEEAHA